MTWLSSRGGGEPQYAQLGSDYQGEQIRYFDCRPPARRPPPIALVVGGERRGERRERAVHRALLLDDRAYHHPPPARRVSHVAQSHHRVHHCNDAPLHVPRPPAVHRPSRTRGRRDRPSICRRLFILIPTVQCKRGVQLLCIIRTSLGNTISPLRCCHNSSPSPRRHLSPRGAALLPNAPSRAHQRSAPLVPLPPHRRSPPIPSFFGSIDHSPEGPTHCISLKEN